MRALMRRPRLHAQAQKRPYAGDFYLTQLKKQRLVIAEEIETMNAVDARSTAA